MAKRVVQECDLCKGEYEPDDTYIISVKKKGKQKPNTYDLCPECAEKIQQQLVAKSSEELPSSWQFQHTAVVPVAFDDGYRGDGIRVDRQGNPVPPLRAEATPEQAADDELIARKEAERRGVHDEYGRPWEEEETTRETPYATVAAAPLDDGSCAHMNRGRIRFDSEFQKPMQQCQDCDEWVSPSASSDVRNARPTVPGGVTLSSHASDRRNRD